MHIISDCYLKDSLYNLHNSLYCITFVDMDTEGVLSVLDQNAFVTGRGRLSVIYTAGI